MIRRSFQLCAPFRKQTLSQRRRDRKGNMATRTMEFLLTWSRNACAPLLRNSRKTVRGAPCGLPMWRRLFLLAVCGMPALWADVCAGLPTGPPGLAGFPLATEPSRLSFRLAVRPGGRAFRITVHNSPFADIEVARCQDGKRLQLLPIMPPSTDPFEPEINFAATFSAYDVNFDGYLDFSVLTYFCQRCAIRSYWEYDPVPDSSSKTS
jgi:hypothetical protein